MVAISRRQQCFAVIPALWSFVTIESHIILGRITVDAFQAIHKELKAKFGCGLDFIHFSNMALHAEQTRLTGKTQTFYRPVKKIQQETEALRQNNFPVYCVLSEQERKLLYQKLIEEMSAKGD